MKEQSTNIIDRTTRIRELNDMLRCRGVGGAIMVTSGIAQLPPETGRTIYRAVETFFGFNPDNDPYGEHDSASLTVENQKIIFKIDYYDRQQRHHSPDPADPSVTCRVLTIMLADEY